MIDEFQGEVQCDKWCDAGAQEQVIGVLSKKLPLENITTQTCTNQFPLDFFLILNKQDENSKKRFYKRILCCLGCVNFNCHFGTQSLSTI